MSRNNFLESFKLACKENKRKINKGFAIALVAAVGIGAVGCSTTDNSDPMSGVYEDYEENEDEALVALIQSYYQYYADGDVESLKTVADPVSEMEESYITYMSQYIEEYQDITLYTKRGADESSYLVSAYIKMKFVDIDTPASGLDFFYVTTTEDGDLVIANEYSSFNQANQENEMDATITALIAEFEQQDDVAELQSKASTELEEAFANDEALNTFVNTTLSDGIITWASDYQAAKDAEAAAAAEAEAAEKAAEEAAAAAEEEANAVTMYATENLDIHRTNEDDSEVIGTIEAGSGVTVYSIDGDWAKVQAKGAKFYVSAAGLAEEEPGTDRSSNGKSYTFVNATNIRSDRSTDSSILAAALPGESVTIIESYADGWTKVEYNGYEGYILTELFQ